MKVLGNDNRLILGIYGETDTWQIEVGEHVDKIECYIEDGDVPWFAIYRDGQIMRRVNSRYVETITY